MVSFRCLWFMGFRCCPLIFAAVSGLLSDWLLLNLSATLAADENFHFLKDRQTWRQADLNFQPKVDLCWTSLAPSYTFAFIQTADGFLLHSNPHPLMSVCTATPPRPPPRPPHLAALILALLPDVVLSSLPPLPPPLLFRSAG